MGDLPRARGRDRIPRTHAFAMAPSPNSALLVGAGCSIEAQKARIAAAAQILEQNKSAALAAERYEECALLRDALVALRAEGAELAPPGEAALLVALRGPDKPAHQVGTSPLHPQLRCTAWCADNRYFNAEVDLLALPLQQPSAWQQSCSAVLGEPGPIGASKRRCQALVAVVDADTKVDSLTELAAVAHEADPELLLLCELGLTPEPTPTDAAAAAALPAAAGARVERLAKLENSKESDEGPLWAWSVEHGFEHVILPWHTAVAVPTNLLHSPLRPAVSTANSEQPQEGERRGLDRVVQALQSTMWGTLVMKPQPELAQSATTTRDAPAGGEKVKESCKPAGNSALVVSFVPALQDMDDANDDDDIDAALSGLSGTETSGAINSASIATALGLGSEYGSVPAMATWRVHNRYFTADVGLRFLDAAAQPSAALEAARATLAEQSPLQTGRSTDSSASPSTVSRCGAVMLILSTEMAKNPVASAQLTEWSDLIARYPDGCSGPEMLALCVNKDAAPYAPAIEWCVDHGYELIRPPTSIQQEEGCEDSSGDGQQFGTGEDCSRSIEKEGVWRLVEALKQNVWGTVRMHEQAGPAPKPQGDAPAASAVKSGGSEDGSGMVAQLEERLLSGKADDDVSDVSRSGGSNTKQTMASMEEMFREVSNFKAGSSTMSRDQRHAAAERIALNWGLLGELDGDGSSESAEEDAELEKFLGDGDE